MRKRLLIDIEEGMLRYGGAVTVDSVHLKLQGKHFYDFTVHFMEIDGIGPFENVRSNIRTMTLFLVEGMNLPNAANIRGSINEALLDKYETTLHKFMRGFAMVTDGAAVMARVANASISRDIHAPDKTWMNFVEHLFNNLIRFVISSYCQLPSLPSGSAGLSFDEKNNRRIQ